MLTTEIKICLMCTGKEEKDIKTIIKKKFVPLIN